MVSDSMKHFGLLCRQVTEEPALKVKEEIIQGFLSRFTGDTGLLLKLLLPKYAQRVYYIQDKQLMRVLSLALRVEEDALRKKLNTNGCIAETACGYFQPTVAVDADGWCSMTLKEFDDFLDAIAAASQEAERVALLKHFFSVACRHVVYYFFREIKLDLRLGAGLRVVLNGLHPSAYNVFKNCANVQEVVRRIKAGPAAPAPAPAAVTDGGTGPAAPHDGHEGEDDDDEGDVEDGAAAAGINTGISLGIPLAPMLAAPARSIDQILAKCPSGAFSEVKYDGERIQIHKQGSKLTFFARSLRPMRDDKYAGLEPFILQAIHATDCVLDGEILMVDVRTSVPLPFGTLGKHKRTQFSSACPCVFLFDILYCNGVSLLGEPMEKRRQELKRQVRFLRNRVMFSELCLIEGRPEQRRALLQQHLQRAIAEGLEGLVVKDKKSTYEPRARHWLKIKKDYLDGLADSADLLVLGAWYGSGSKGGQLSTFLMGCVDPAVAPGGAGRFKTVCKVGNGLKDNEIAAISAAYSKRMVSTAATRGDGHGGVPAWLHCQSAHLPDMVLRDPESADVMEVVGAELSVTKTHTSGISIRFPRILKIRTDKTVDTATTLRELQALFRVSREKLSLAGVDSSLRLADSYTVMADDDEDAEDSSLPAAPTDAMEASGEDSTGLPVTTNVSRTARRPLSLPPSAEGSRHTAPAAVTYVAKGDAAAPAIPPAEPFVLVHSVAAGGRWSARGVMRRISETYGPAAGKAYEQAAASAVVGQVIYTEVGPVSRPGRVFVASAVAQRAAAAGQVPPLDQSALEKALSNAAAYAQRHGASLHLVVPASETGVAVPPLLELVENLCALRDVSCYVYGLPPSAIPAQPQHTPAAPRSSASASRAEAPVTPPPQMVSAVAETAAAAPPCGDEGSLHFSRGRGRRFALLYGVVAQVVHGASSAAEAAETGAVLELMHGRCAAVGTGYQRALPCTHVVVVGDGAVPHMDGELRHSVFVVSGAWVRDCFDDGVRYSECVYRLDSTRPTALLLAGQSLFLSRRLMETDGPRWRRLARLLGAALHESWQLTGQRTSFALTDAWDEECAEVYRLGGWVLHSQWLEDCAVAAVVLPLDAYVFSPAPPHHQPGSGGDSARPLTGKSMCVFPSLSAHALSTHPLASFCARELGASLAADVASADVVLLMSGTAAVRQAAAAAGAPASKLVDVEWVRRCAAGNCFVTPSLLARKEPLPPQALRADSSKRDGSAAAARALSETSSTATYASEDDG